MPGGQKAFIFDITEVPNLELTIVKSTIRFTKLKSYHSKKYYTDTAYLAINTYEYRNWTWPRNLFVSHLLLPPLKLVATDAIR